MSEVMKYVSWSMSLSHWKCKCLEGVKKKKKRSGLTVFAVAIFCWVLGFGIFFVVYLHICFSLDLLYIFDFSIINVY